MRVIVVALLLLLIALLTVELVDQALEQDNAVTVKTTQTWGRTAPPYVIESSMFTTTTQPRARTAPNRRVVTMTGASHPCGPQFDLPPCYVMMRESRGDPNAYNPTGCGGRGCRGKWQCDPRTCSGTGTEEQQDAEARAIWNHGRGCAHWSACG